MSWLRALVSRAPLGEFERRHGFAARWFLRRHYGHDVRHMSDYHSCGFMCRTCPGYPISSL